LLKSEALACFLWGLLAKIQNMSIRICKPFPRLALLCLLGFFAACAALQKPEQADSFTESTHPLRILPLPGSLDSMPVLHSNSPERIEQSGILVSTLPAGDLNQGRKLGIPLQGRFELFMHHVARTAVLSSARVYLAVVASNPSQESLRLTLKKGAFFRTWPEAPFKPVAGIHNNPRGELFSGPGDRLALAVLRDESTLNPQQILLAPGEQAVIFLEAIPTNPLWVLQQDNALSALLSFESLEPVHLSVLSWVSDSGSPPRPQDLLTLLASGQVAGPPEIPVTEYDPAKPPPAGGFRYGRVAGMVSGASWRGKLEDLPQAPGERVGFPLSSVYLKRMGTGQNQSAPLRVRVPGTAVQSHGNYGVHYLLEADLQNPDPQARSYAVYLHQPLKVIERSPGEALAVFRSPPAEAVFFRGSLRLSWGPEQKPEDFWLHQVLRAGEEAPALKVLVLPAGETRRLKLELVYPPDATPPQLLEIHRLS